MSVSAVFDESFYLTNNEDVVLALAQRHFTSALQHFEAFGAAELRNPNAQFNSSYYAAQNPNEIDGLIIIGSGVIADNNDLKKVKENTGDPIIFDLLRTEFPFKTQLLYITPRFFASQGAKTAIFDHTLVTDELVTQYHEIALLEGSRMAFNDMMSGINDEDFLDDIDLLKSIKSPTLVIHGEKDNLVSLWSVDYFIKNISQAQYKLYPNIGHFPVYENPLQSASDINKFLLSLK